MSRPTVNLEGRVAAVTGGARGMGRAVAQSMARRGMKVAIGDLDLDLAEAAAAEIGPTAIALPLDVTDAASFATYLDAAEERLGPLYSLFNNAGIMLTGLYRDEEEERTEAMVDVNVRGVATGSRLVLPRLLGRGAGHLLNMGSVASNAGYPGIATYCATKFYVLGLSEALRVELANTGVEVSCVMPGFVDTELTAGVEDTRLFRRIAPEQVAKAVVGSLERPRFQVFVPRSIGPFTATTNLLPERLRNRATRAMGVDRILLGADPDAKARYTKRALRGRRDR